MVRLYAGSGLKARVRLIFLLLLGVCATVDPSHARVPLDPHYSIQEQVYNRISAPEAWDYTVGSDDVIVAVIDTGVDVNHPDLAGHIWRNKGEIVGNQADDDKNGYVDDTHGWNFVDDTNDPSIAVIEKTDNFEAVNHGTILAGLIGAIANNEIAGAGLNWKVRIMPVRAIDNSGSGSLMGVARAIEYAADNGAHIVSLSFVGDIGDPLLKTSLQKAYEKGVLIVSAAGNNRKEGDDEGDLSRFKKYPICYDLNAGDNWILGVTSVDPQDRLSSFANYGNCVDISAPGENIYSTQRYAPQFGYQKQFDGAWFGTSFSVPLVAGGAALVKSIRPDWGAKELIPALLKNVDDIEGLNLAFAGQMGYGRLNVGKAVAAAAASISRAITPSSAQLNSIDEEVNRFYFLHNNHIYSYSIQSNRQVKESAGNGSVIINFAVADLTNDGAPEMVLLIRKNGKDSIRLMNSDGSVMKEFALQPYTYRSVTSEAVRVRVVFENGLPLLVIEQKNKRYGRSRFSQYSLTGSKLSSIDVSSPVLWDAVGDEYLVVGMVRNATLAIQALTWKGTVAHRWTLGGGVRSLVSLRELPQEKDALTLALTVNRNGLLEQIVLDLLTSSWRTSSLNGVVLTDRPAVMVSPHGIAVIYLDTINQKMLVLNEKGELLKDNYLAVPGTQFVMETTW